MYVNDILPLTVGKKAVEDYIDVELPHGAHLKYSYVIAGKTVIQFDRIDELNPTDIYETDRILIHCIDTTCEIIEWVWSDPISIVAKNVFAESTAGRIRINKDMYIPFVQGYVFRDEYFYFVEDDTRYLVDEYGNIVGKSIPLPLKSAVRSLMVEPLQHSDVFGGYICSGPDNGEDVWSRYCVQAQQYFTKAAVYYNDIVYQRLPPKEDVLAHVSDPDTKIMYIIAHGSSSACLLSDGRMYGVEIGEAMKNREPMVFVKLDHCDAMVDTESSMTFTQNYLKGDPSAGCILGHANMSGSGAIDSLWQYENKLFRNIFDEKMTVYESYLDALTYYPALVDIEVFYGNTSIRLME